MKPLKPSMREKKRYLLVKGKISEVEEAIFKGIGIIGMSKIGLNWIKKSKDGAILSLNRKSVDSVKACFSIWPNRIIVEKISGTLKGLKGKKK